MPDAAVFRLRSNMPGISYKIHEHFVTVEKVRPNVCVCVCVCVCVRFFNSKLCSRRFRFGELWITHTESINCNSNTAFVLLRRVVLCEYYSVF